jgi:hypothetical protein
VNPINYTVAQTDSDLFGILKLQRQNLASAISREEALEQGFVTVEHDFALLKRMNEPYPHIIAKDVDIVVGYTLVMLRELRKEIPVLVEMFEKIDSISYDGKILRDANYVTMGQVCIAKGYRGRGIFQGLYAEMAKRLTGIFEYIITEVSLRNPRSIRAHEKVGFETVKEYKSREGEDWVIMLWKIGNVES